MVVRLKMGSVMRMGMLPYLLKKRSRVFMYSAISKKQNERVYLEALWREW
jgi:hypothetical protein